MDNETIIHLFEKVDKDIENLRKDIHDFRGDLKEFSIFRWKVQGSLVVVTIFFSVVFQIFLNYLTKGV